MKTADAKAGLVQLRERLQQVNDIERAAAVLSWDQATYMPPGGAAARGRQMAVLGSLAHERFTDPVVGTLLDALMPWAEGCSADDDDAALVRVARRKYERSVRVPNSLVAELSAHQAASYDAWTRARPANDFAAVRPLLEKTVDLSRRLAECFAPYEHVMDPLIDMYDYGMRVSSVSRVFADLRTQLTPLVDAVAAQGEIDDSFLKQRFAEKRQWDFGVVVVKKLGYDFERGRQDKTHHPFCTTFSIGDVRITTRFNEHDLGDGLFSTMHEAGHAMYEQGIDARFEGTPLAEGTSAGVHESQSRLWENVIGRSREFWEFYYPKLQRKFGRELRDVSLEQFHRAINKVRRSLIRVDADELTYNLHVILRFDLERQMLEGTLAAKDLPEAWNARYASDLGVTPQDDRDGCLQDVHWFGGIVGGSFQGYTLGNVLSAMFYRTALNAHPEIPEQVRRGRFSTLHRWLVKNIYRHGSKYTAPELIRCVTGGDLDVGPYVSYLRGKYTDLYGIP
ncbi:MAG: carboxypeptidase M32 [Chloroflexi bacterium]|nr:carboxypeptidase M32 [Chloroflexota bacterium]